MTKVPPFSEIATLGHSGSQAEQLVHCEAMIFNGIDRSLCGRDQRALANFRIAALHVLDLAAIDLVQIALEPADRRFLDELVGELVDRLDARLDQVALRANTDLGHEYGVAIVDSAGGCC